MVNLPYSFSVRLAIVKKVGRSFVDFEFLDRLDNQTFRAPIPHPYAGRGGGIFAGVERDTIVLVSSGPGEKWYVVSTVPDNTFNFDLEGAEDIRYNETRYPELKPGEMFIKGNLGQYMHLNNRGSITIDAGLGNGSADIELSNATQTEFRRLPQTYEFGEYGRSIKGLIKRDLNDEEPEDVTQTLNFLDSEAYDTLLSEIGRHPEEEVQNRTVSLLKQVVRNPGLVENRTVVYEYGDSFNVQDFDSETAAIGSVEKGEVSEIELLQTDPSHRNRRRTDILNLNLNNFNHLIERTEGTVVDIYGNILDINRNRIILPDIDELASSGDTTQALRTVYDYHRRSIKVHYEINSRKPINSSEPPETDLNKNNAANFSRWSFDVDAEGLTKINIPASSNTGNIPVLSRYFTSRDEDNPKDGAFKDEDRRDIRVKSFGPGGIQISGDEYVPETIDGTGVEVGTAWHDISSAAGGIINERAVSPTINNKINSSEANAGGRSAHLNLDGSVELSIGADTVDHKSMLLDTKGGIVSRIGSDINGRSITSSLDGEVILEIGGESLADDTVNFGRLVIHVNRKDGDPQRIIIDDSGMTFDIQGGIYMRSSTDMTLEAGGRMLLQATDIGFYGSGDIEERTVSGVERKVIHTGLGDHM